LDHGVCGGLLLLLYSTFYFKLYFGLPQDPPAGSLDRAIWIRFREATNERFPPDPRDNAYHALWWWRGVLWGTAATAMHNIQQLGAESRDPHTNLGSLKLEEDPIAYLGILVDCLEEWDRYTVRRESVVQGVLPLQGKDVGLSTIKGIITIDYGDTTRSDLVKRALNEALADWDQIVEIR
jgi:hypothetical protein